MFEPLASNVVEYYYNTIETDKISGTLVVVPRTWTYPAVNTARHNELNNSNQTDRTDGLTHVEMNQVSLLPVALEFVRRIMPSEEAYVERKSLFPSTYGNSTWVEARIAEGIQALSQPMSPRSQRASALFDLLGMRRLGRQKDEANPGLQSTLESFSSTSDLHRAVSAYTAIVTNLMNGYTKFDDWDGFLTNLIEIPEQRYPTLELEQRFQIALLYFGNNDWVSKVPKEFVVPSADLLVVDLESLRLDVLKNMENSMGLSSLYKSGADAAGETESLVYACTLLRRIRSINRENIPFAEPRLDGE
ncbi:MAG: hypothetical protein KDD62_04315 [Bdellovibrionales bacterium]|nr:hypothetical protein [Bdellovibrionales bacterium]